MRFPAAKTLFISVDVQPASLKIDRPEQADMLQRMVNLRQRMAEHDVACWQIGMGWPDSDIAHSEGDFRSLLPPLPRERLFGKKHGAPKSNAAFAEALQALQPAAIIMQGCFLDACGLKTLLLACDLVVQSDDAPEAFAVADCGRVYPGNDLTAIAARAERHVHVVRRAQLEIGPDGIGIAAPARPHALRLRAAPEDPLNFG